MELLCPNCQKKLTVPEQYAGQLMRCPLCQGTFTVPAMPSSVAAESSEPVGFFAPPTKQDTYAVSPEPAATTPPLPPLSSESPSAAPTGSATQSVAAAPSTPSGGYSRVCAMKIKPDVVQWLPLGFVVVFVLTFFPWIPVIKVSAWGLAFGMKIEGIEVMPGRVLVVFFVLLTIPAALLAVASVLFALKLIPDVPALKPMLPLRSLVVGAIGGVAWLCITLQYAIWLLSGDAVAINLWGLLAWLICTIAVTGSFLDFWLGKRGSGKPIPRISMEW